MVERTPDNTGLVFNSDDLRMLEAGYGLDGTSESVRNAFGLSMTSPAVEPLNELTISTSATFILQGMAIAIQRFRDEQRHRHAKFLQSGNTELEDAAALASRASSTLAVIAEFLPKPDQ